MTQANTTLSYLQRSVNQLKRAERSIREVESLDIPNDSEERLETIRGQLNELISELQWLENDRKHRNIPHDKPLFRAITINSDEPLPF